MSKLYITMFLTDYFELLSNLKLSPKENLSIFSLTCELVLTFFKIPVESLSMWRHDIQHNDIQHNDSQHDKKHDT